MTKIAKNLKKPLVSIGTFVVVFLLTVVFAFAAGDTPKIVSGTVDLFTAASGWLMLIIPIASSAVLGFFAWQKSVTDDQAIISEKNRLMKNVLIGAIIAETSSSLVYTILKFYQ